MRNLENDFKSRKILYPALLSYGFQKQGDVYFLEKEICNHSFKVVVEITQKSKMSKVMDMDANDEYILVDVEQVKGSFVGTVKEEYEKILKEIIENCTENDAFKSKQAQEIIKYISKNYQDSLEYLWEKSKDTAVVRNKESQKWYGIFFVLNEEKLGLPSNKTVDVLNLRYPKEKIRDIVDNEKVFLGYHMNKQHWISIVLDGSIPLEKIMVWLSNSYKMACKK